MERNVMIKLEEPKLWRDMTDAEKGALLLAHHEGKVIEWSGISATTGGLTGWSKCPNRFLWYGEFEDMGFAYRVKPEPKVETVTLYGNTDGTTYLNFGLRGAVEFDTHRITFDTIDGEPDVNSVKMEKL
jgi:hypothetical protein